MELTPSCSRPISPASSTTTLTPWSPRPTRWTAWRRSHNGCPTARAVSRVASAPTSSATTTRKTTAPLPRSAGVARVDEEQDHAEHRDAAGEAPREQQPRPDTEGQCTGGRVGGQRDRRDGTGGAGHEQGGDAGGGQAPQQGGDAGAQPHQRVRGGGGGGGGDPDGAGDPEEPAGPGGGHRGPA